MKKSKCTQCKKFLSKRQNQKKNKFCGPICYYKSRIKNVKRRFCLICKRELSRAGNLKGQRFCSKKCFGKYCSNRIKMGTFFTPTMRKKIPERSCLFCQKSLRKRQIILNQKFCSVKCRALSERILKSRICPICQKPLTYKQLQKKQIYCSVKCQKIANGLYLKGRFTGPNSFNWKGGISFEPYDLAFNDELKDLIRKRDNYKCQLCKAPQIEFFKKLPIHHIDYDKKNSNPINLIALCIGCNGRVNKDRKFWQRFFTEYQKERLKAGKIQLNSKKKEEEVKKYDSTTFKRFAAKKEGSRYGCWLRNRLFLKQSHQNIGETPGLHQGNPNVKTRAILRGASPAETVMMGDVIQGDKSISSIIRRASSNEKMKR